MQSSVTLPSALLGGFFREAQFGMAAGNSMGLHGCVSGCNMAGFREHQLVKSFPTPFRSTLVLAAFIMLTFCAPLAGIFSPPGDWYASLQKPGWNPPPWIFGPVWTALYIMMAVAAWLVWRHIGWQRPLWLYLTQLVLNATWTPVFFGAREIGLAFAVIVALWVAIFCTLLAFLRVSQAAGWILLPYLAWVSFAAVLNFTLWRMNPA